MGSSFLRNRIINGAMQIWQRGTSFSTPSSGAYTADRFYVGWAGAAPATVARVTGPTGFSYALRVTGAASNTTTTVGQKIESANIADLASKTVTLSVVLLASSSQTFTWAAYYANATDDFSGVTQISTGTWSVTTSAATYTANISLPSQAANGVQIQIYPASAGAFTSGTFDMTGFQVEQGSVATPFERRLIGQELALCQRYYWNESAPQYSVASTSNGSAISATVSCPVPMRTSPTVTNPFTDGNYNTSPTGSQWYFTQPYVGASTKTGTVSPNAAGGALRITFYFNGATFSNQPTAINAAGSCTVQASAEL